jgi:hypothetical protein
MVEIIEKKTMDYFIIILEWRLEGKKTGKGNTFVFPTDTK